MNEKILFNDGWQFAKSGLEDIDTSVLTFEPVDIPHDWLIYNTLNLYEDSIGWYRKNFTCSKEDKQILLCFDGVYMDSSLYINGEFVGEWKYGYSSFEHDITSALKDGENEVVLKVVHQSPNSRWYSGAGIYRNVWLKIRDKNHIVTNGIYVGVKQKDKRWEVEVDTELDIYEEAQLTHTIMYKDKIVASSKNVIHVKGSSVHDEQVIIVEDPMLWSPEEPNLYKLITELYIGNETKIESIKRIFL